MARLVLLKRELFISKMQHSKDIKNKIIVRIHFLGYRFKLFHANFRAKRNGRCDSFKVRVVFSGLRVGFVSFMISPSFNSMIRSAYFWAASKSCVTMYRILWHVL